MSELGGCVVCGCTLSTGEYLRCHDCVDQHYMEQTGTKAIYIKLTDKGPEDVTEYVLYLQERHINDT